jgi:hypothetical protein
MADSERGAAGGAIDGVRALDRNNIISLIKIFQIMKNLIFRGAYRNLRQDRLNTFAGDVVDRLKGNTLFTALQSDIDLLDGAAQQYDSWLKKARAGSQEDRLAKDVAKAVLIEHLDIVAMMLERTAAGSLQYLAASGYPLRTQLRNSYEGPVDGIVNLMVTPTRRPGEVRCVFEHPQPRAVKVFATEYSTDKGEVWSHKTYDDRRNVLLQDLPKSPELWLRVRAIGRKGQLSPWSDPVMVGVT